MRPIISLIHFHYLFPFLKHASSWKKYSYPTFLTFFFLSCIFHRKATLRLICFDQVDRFGKPFSGNVLTVSTNVNQGELIQAKFTHCRSKSAGI